MLTFSTSFDGSLEPPPPSRRRHRRRFHVAYLVNQYPAVSHTFIRREIEALERLGVVVDRIALRGWDAEVVDAADKAEQAKTRFVLKDGVPALVMALGAEIWRSPRLAFRAFVSPSTWLGFRIDRRRSTSPTWPKHVLSADGLPKARSAISMPLRPPTPRRWRC